MSSVSIQTRCRAFINRRMYLLGLELVGQLHLDDAKRFTELLPRVFFFFLIKDILLNRKDLGFLPL